MTAKMEGDRSHGSRTNVIKKVKLKLCTVNICGMSNRSRMVINSYIENENIDILLAQETGSCNSADLELHNMHLITDTNDAANKGAALYVNQNHSITNLDTISKKSKNLDSCWGLVVAFKKRFIIGNVYVKLNHKPAISEKKKKLKRRRTN